MTDPEFARALLELGGCRALLVLAAAAIAVGFATWVIEAIARKDRP